MNHTTLVILAIFGSLIWIAFTSDYTYADNMACQTFIHNRDTIVCLNHNSHTVVFGNPGNQRDYPATSPTPAITPPSTSPTPAITPPSTSPTPAITLPAHTLPSQTAPVILNLQFNTPTTAYVPGVGKIMATATQSLSGGTCNSRSYPVNSNIGPICLTFDWSTLS
jgi:hypothetical protein